MTDAEESDDERRRRGLPPAPQMSGDQREHVDPPTPVKVSFLLWIISAVVLVAGYAYGFTVKQEIIDQVIELNNDPNISDEQLRSGVESLLWTLVIGAAVFGALFVLFAYKAREGTRSARSVLTVLVAVMVIFQLLLFSNLITLIAAFGTIIALVLMYLPSVADYFPKVPKSLS